MNWNKHYVRTKTGLIELAKYLLVLLWIAGTISGLVLLIEHTYILGWVSLSVICITVVSYFLGWIHEDCAKHNCKERIGIGP